MPRELIDIPLNGGLREKTDERYLELNTLVSATNAIWVSQNALEKRPGWLSAAKTIKNPGVAPNGGTITATSLTAGQALIPTQTGVGPTGQITPTRTSLALTDGTSIYSYNPAANVQEWCDYISPCVGVRRTVSAAPASAYNPTVASWNGHDLFVWEDVTNGTNVFTNQIYFALVNEATGQIVQSGTINATGQQPRVVILGTFAVVCYAASATVIAAAGLDLSTGAGAWTFLGNITTTYTNTGFGVSNPGVSVVTGGNTYNCFALAYLNGSTLTVAMNGNQVGTATLTGFGTDNVTVPGANYMAVSIRWTPANSWAWLAVASNDGTTNTHVYGALLGITFSAGAFHFNVLLAPTVVATYSLATAIDQISVEDTGVGALGHRCEIVFQHHSNVSPNQVGWVALSSAGSVGTLVDYGWRLILMSDAFAVTDANGALRLYAMVASTDTQQTQFLVEIDYANPGLALRPVCAIAPRLAVETSSNLRRAWTLSQVTSYGQLAAASYVAAGAISETNNSPANLAVLSASFQFAHPARGLAVQVGALTYGAGGIPFVFDGENAVESSTLTDGSVGATPSATGGSLTNSQTYFYVIVPEWRDARGNVHQGQPSAPVSAAVPAGAGTAGSVQLTIPVVQLTNKGTPMRIGMFPTSKTYLVPYRTVFQGGAMSTNFYRVVGDAPPGTLANNVIAGASVSYTDTASDAQLAAGSLLPTTGGVLEADCPSSFAAICSHSDRVYGVGDDLRTIWISTVSAQGIPCSFNDGSQSYADLIGDITAIWSQDDKVFIGNATGIAYAVGSGPNITGTQSDLSPWEPIPTDVGPIDPRAVCVTQIGTVFRHAFGLGLLDRSLQMHSDFGDPITNALTGGNAYAVTAIELHPTRPEILVFLNIDNVGGAIATYNYRFNAWSIASVADPDSGSGACPNAALVSGGNLFMLTAAGRLWREKTLFADTKLFYDSAASDVFVPLSVTTGWLKLGGKLQGLGFAHKALLSWVPQDWSNVVITTASDYQDGVAVDTWTWAPSAVSAFATLGVPTVVEMRPMPARRTAIQFTISDTEQTDPTKPPLSSTGQGPKIVALSCEVEPFGGAIRLPGAQRS